MSGPRRQREAARCRTAGSRPRLRGCARLRLRDGGPRHALYVTRSAEPADGQTAPAGDALDVVGHREQVEGRAVVRAGSRARAKIATSRARAAGSQATYATARGRRGDDRLDDGTAGALARRVEDDQVDRRRREPLEDRADVTRRGPWRRARSPRRARTRPRSPSTSVTPDGSPTASARNRANSPTPAYRSSTDSPGRGARKSSTVSTSTSGAPGCTCQKPSALDLERRCRARCGRPAAPAIRQSSTSTTSCDRCLRIPRRPPGSST